MTPDEAQWLSSWVNSASEDELAQLESIINADSMRELAESSLYDFLVQAWPSMYPGTVFQPGKHIEAIADHLEAVTRGDIRRLIINVPFRTSKSSLVNIAWPAWVWCRNPHHQWLCISHSHNLAKRDTVAMRRLIASPWYQRNWPLAMQRDQNEKNRFENVQRGTRIAMGLSANIIGESGDTIILDDPIDRDQAMSEVERESANERISEKVKTRLNDQNNGAIVLVMQRLHEADATGFLLEQGGWDHLCLPMRFEHNHPHLSNTSLGFSDWRTQDGELLCPERFSEETVREFESQGPRFAAGQLQQRPAPREGAMFKRDWFRIVQPHELPPKFRKMQWGWDTAASEGEGDYTAGVLMAFDHNDLLYVLEVIRGQWSAGSRNQIIQTQCHAANHRYKHKIRVFAEQEGGGGGKEAAEYLRAFLVKSGLSAKTETVSGKGSKENRAQPLADRAEIVGIRLLAGEWNVPYLNELCVFPNGSHDDQVDASSAAYNELHAKNSQVLSGLGAKA